MKALGLVQVISIAELKGIDRKVAPGLEVLLTPSMKRYLFNPGSTAADDGNTIIAPDASPGGCCEGGRWELETVTVPTPAPTPALQVATLDFIGFGAGDLIVPTGFVPKLVIVHAGIHWSNPHGAISVGSGVGTGVADQSATYHGDAVPSGFTLDNTVNGLVIFLANPIGAFGATSGSITQMDATQVKITTDGGGSCRVTVLG